MGDDAERRQADGEAVEEDEEELDGNDGVDESREELFREDGVLFYELGEVV